MNKTRAGAALALTLCLSPTARGANAAAPETAAERDASAGRRWKEKLGLNADQETKFLAALKAKVKPGTDGTGA